MATSGQMKGDTIGNGNYIYINWELDSQSISGNSSKISWSCYYHWNMSDAQLDNGNAYLSGSRWDNGGRVYNYSGNISTRNMKLASGSFTLGHNSDGTKSLSVSGSITEYGAGTSNGSKSFSLPTIPRNATITGGTSTMNDEQNPTLTWSNPAGSAIDTLQGAIYRTDGSTALFPYTNLSQTGSSYTFALTTDQRNTLRSWMANTNSLQLRMYLRSVIGGEDERPYRTITVSLVNGNPTFDDAEPLTYADTNAATVAVTGDNQKIVQNISDLVATIGSATPKKYATIANYKVTIGTETQTVTSPGAIDFDTVNLTEDTPITVVVTDSRGNTATYSRTVSILPWQPPRAVVSAARVNNYEDDTTVKADVTIDPVNGGNAITSLKVRYKKTDAVTWSEKSIASGVEDEITIDKLFQWNVQFVVVDQFGSTTYNLLVSKGIPIMFIDNQKLSIGIGKFPDTNEALEVDDQYLVPIMKKVYQIGDIIVTTDATNPQSRPQLNGTVWTAWGTGRVPVGFDAGQTEFNAVEKTGGAKTHTHPLSAAGYAYIYISSGNNPYSYQINVSNRSGNGAANAEPITQGDITNAAALGGNTDAATTLQPYITCYFWKRTA